MSDSNIEKILKLVDLIIDGTIDKAVQGNVTAYRVKKCYKNRH